MNIKNFLKNEKQKCCPCPCCGFLTMTGPARDTYDICPVCDWEDDEVQYKHPNREGGANTVSLNQARANYAKFGAKTMEASSDVRSPLPDEIPPKKE
jgi:hypothetical protein